MMKPICVLALGALFVGCHLDKLVSGGGGPTSTAPPAHIVFTTPPPQTATLGQKLTPAVRVSLVDSAGVPVAGFDTTMVVIALGANPGNATLQGTKSVHPVRGVATFADLWLDQPGTGYTLTASAPKLDTVSTPFNITPPPPTTGSITVTTSTTGLDLDLDGYTVTVDGSTSQSIATNSGSSGVTFPGLAAGNHTVKLDGVASNCTVSGNNPRTVNVAAGSGGSTGFAITCAAPPAGNLTVTTTTNGPNQPSGYTVTVDAGASSQPVGTTGSVTFNNLSVGSHTVSLSPIPANCSVSGANPQTVSVIASNTAQASFTITCSATTGDLVVTTTTGGSDLDPDGYTVTAAGTSKAILTNGSVTFSGVQAGAQNVALSGIASNCSVTNANPMSVTVPAGGVGHADFAISCAAQPPPDQPPVVNAGGNQTHLFGSVTLNWSFTDPDNDAPWTYSIDWDDGSAPETGTTSTQGARSASHSYGINLVGNHNVRVSVTDSHGLSGSDTAVITVVLSLAPPGGP